MTLERKKQILIDQVMTRFDVAYRLKEQASDAALKALADGCGLLESMQVAEQFIAEHS